ncbi:MAG: ATP-binding protein [Muribaculaceae bacterium]|nr:ATP-binding protein [Muribaculaceae bacterium]
MEERVRYAIGDQDFKSLREGGYLYVDKTQFIHKLINTGIKYCFLARPRRFGKSLFLSTLRYFFEGRRHLFNGLFIDSTDWKWQQYPVLYLDLNRDRCAEPGILDSILDYIFSGWEKDFGIEAKGYDISSRFANIIKNAHEKTGRQVVILVDEYDKPLVGNLNSDANFGHYRAKLASLYSNFKSAAEHIRLVFLTGVSRFSKLSVFSDLNNINDITFDNDFADICGITSSELLVYFQSGIETFAKKEKIDFGEAVRLLKTHYDGYRFAEEGSDIFNPWSLLNAMDKSKIEYFWNDTGIPTILAEALKRIHANLQDTFDSYCSEDDLKGLDLLNPSPIALLYQTGYLTIKNYDRLSGEYRLGIPNMEVKRGLFRVLVPYYVSTIPIPGNRLTDDIARNFLHGNPQKAMRAMQAYFAGIDYAMRIESENNFHNAFYLLMNLIGLKTKTESHTSSGRIDIEVQTPEFIYIIELKYDHSAEEALRQIDEKNYARKFQTDSRKIFKIGVAFSSKTRCIENWIIS